MQLLKETGPVPGEENGVKPKKGGKDDEASRKRKRGGQNVSGFLLLASLIDHSLLVCLPIFSPLVSLRCSSQVFSSHLRICNLVSFSSPSGGSISVPCHPLIVSSNLQWLYSISLRPLFHFWPHLRRNLSPLLRYPHVSSHHFPRPIMSYPRNGHVASLVGWVAG